MTRRTRPAADRQGGDVRGLTTAASLWAASAIGMTVGAGYLFGAATATALAMATLYALRRFRSSVIFPMRLGSADDAAHKSASQRTLSDDDHSEGEALSADAIASAQRLHDSLAQTTPSRAK